jgi:hypothetical protein
LDTATIEALKLQLKGEQPLFLVNEDQPIDVGPGFQHGQILAIMTAMDRLGLPDLISPPGQKRDLVLAMIINRILKPSSQLTTTKWWSTTTLSNYLDIQNIDENDLYDAMDWLLPLQPIIERRLSIRHLFPGDSIFYDVSSTYMEYKIYQLTKIGNSSNKKMGKLQINYGLLTDKMGCPINIELYPGNISDPTTFIPMVETIRNKFNISKIIIIGDRGRLGAKNIEILKGMDGIDWITSLNSVSIQS